jgi:hypothetical protein
MVRVMIAHPEIQHPNEEAGAGWETMALPVEVQQALAAEGVLEQYVVAAFTIGTVPTIALLLDFFFGNPLYRSVASGISWGIAARRPQNLIDHK